ncbi:hypothetical protein HMPREF0027_2092 [Actinobacillus ureae ATCC 25976]|uniref:Uncharacterized protein n=1 Tax=Actinobacillus ureae ATCC 25976 TaxID=887324 RepID=E8KJS5_9PAST|nr:hypothetical protein HMPREF0027_2092 [Actinobacillus ureae ATCC 25976]
MKLATLTKVSAGVLVALALTACDDKNTDAKTTAKPVAEKLL